MNMSLLLELATDFQGSRAGGTSGAGIVYATSRAATEQLARRIAETGREVGFYHAGLPPERRSAVQAEFVAAEDMVMVATIAFGMGIDKPDVRFVAHLDRPYGHVVWVAGRAGAYLHLHDPERGFEVWHVDAFRARFSGRFLRLEAVR